MNEVFGEFSTLVSLGDAVQHAVLMLALCSTRLFAVYMVLPATSSQTIQGRMRGGLAMCLGFFIAWGQPAVMVKTMTITSLALMVGKEAFLGLLLGYAASTVFWVAEGVGVLIDNQAGYNNVQQTNPLSGQQSTPIGNLLGQLAISGFYMLGGMLVLTNIIFESFKWWPLASMTPVWTAVLEDFIRIQTGHYLELTVKIAAPALLVLVLVDLGFGILSKTAEKLEPNSLAQPVKGAVAIAMLSLLVAVFFAQVRPALALHTLAREMEMWSKVPTPPLTPAVQPQR